MYILLYWYVTTVGNKFFEHKHVIDAAKISRLGDKVRHSKWRVMNKILFESATSTLQYVVHVVEAS